MNNVRQCAILVGGLGTRMGELTDDMPKPLLDCGGRPFLSWILREISRFGIEEVVLLAGYKSERVESFCRGVVDSLPRPLKITISVEPFRAGTGGAVWHARHLLQERFLLINGDSWIDTDLGRFLAVTAHVPEAAGCVLLRSMEDCRRYGTAELREGQIVAFHEKSPQLATGLINGGLYILDRRALERLTPQCSLEQDLLPALASEGLLLGQVHDGFFIDIGIPSDYERAGVELPSRLLRPAAIFLWEVLTTLSSPGSLVVWRPGTLEALRLLNIKGYLVFAVNCPPLASDYLPATLLDDLLANGVSLDDHRATLQGPTNPDITGLLDAWEANSQASFLIGTDPTEMCFAQKVIGKSVCYKAYNLLELVQSLLSGNVRS